MSLTMASGTNGGSKMKRPSGGEVLDVVKLQAHAEHGFKLLYYRVPRDFLASGVAKLAVGW